MAGAQRRVPGERQLGSGGEDPYPVVGAWLGGRQGERRFGKVRPVREALHLFGAQSVRVEYDGDRIAVIGGGCEDIDLGKSAGHVGSLLQLVDPTCWCSD